MPASAEASAWWTLARSRPEAANASSSVSVTSLARIVGRDGRCRQDASAPMRSHDRGRYPWRPIEKPFPPLALKALREAPDRLATLL
jgi:hypothetical protein